MIKHIWSILAQKSILESETNSLSIIDILEQLTVGIQPNKLVSKSNNTVIVPIAYEIVSLLSRDDDKGTLKPKMIIQLVNPEGKILRTSEHEVKWEDGKRRLRTRVKIIGLPVDTSGIYVFKVGIKEENATEYKITSELPIDINIIKELPSTPVVSKGKDAV